MIEKLIKFLFNAEKRDFERVWPDKGIGKHFWNKFQDMGPRFLYEVDPSHIKTLEKHLESHKK